MPQPQVVHAVKVPRTQVLPTVFTASPPLWEEAVSVYLRDCRRRSLSPATIEQYDWVLRTGNRLRIWREDYGITTVADLTASTLRSLESDLVDAGMNPVTVGTIHRRVRTFAAWCEKHWGVAGDVRDVEAPIEPKHDPQTYTDAELDRIFAAARNNRDRLILRVLLRTGVRAAELCGLDCDDVVNAPDGYWLRIRQGKGRKDRVVPIDTPGYRLSTLLEHYVLKERPPSTSPALFLTELRDRGGTYDRLGVRGLQSLMRRLSDTTGLNVHAHAFRHTFATKAIAAGVNPLHLQRVLGHTTLRMVTHYVHSSPSDLLDAWSRRPD